MSGNLVVSCPKCQAQFKLSSRALLGKVRDCPNCGHSFAWRAAAGDSAAPDSRRKSSSAYRSVVLLAGCLLAVGVAVGAALLVNGRNHEADPAENDAATGGSLKVVADDTPRPSQPSQPSAASPKKVEGADPKTKPAGPQPAEAKAPTPTSEPTSEHPLPPKTDRKPTPLKIPTAEPEPDPPTPKPSVPKPPTKKQPTPKSPAPKLPTPAPTPASIAARLLAEAPQDLPKLNRGVLAFAVKRFGQKVGRGECWDLAADALKAVGARRAKGYTFGQRVKLENVKPGDILQFHKARFQTKRFWQVLGAPQHTAVVAAVADTKIVLLHQNIGAKRFVQLGQIDLKNLQSGTIIGFRAVRR